MCFFTVLQRSVIFLRKTIGGVGFLICIFKSIKTAGSGGYSFIFDCGKLFSSHHVRCFPHAIIYGNACCAGTDVIFCFNNRFSAVHGNFYADAFIHSGIRNDIIGKQIQGAIFVYINIDSFCGTVSFSCDISLGSYSIVTNNLSGNPIGVPVRAFSFGCNAFASCANAVFGTGRSFIEGDAVCSTVASVSGSIKLICFHCNLSIFSCDNSQSFGISVIILGGSFNRKGIQSELTFAPHFCSCCGFSTVGLNMARRPDIHIAFLRHISQYGLCICYSLSSDISFRNNGNITGNKISGPCNFRPIGTSSSPCGDCPDSVGTNGYFCFAPGRGFKKAYAGSITISPFRINMDAV